MTRKHIRPASWRVDCSGRCRHRAGGGAAVGVHPQTDDAEVFANLIGIAPEVNGRIVTINVKDNQFVRKGDLLFEIDPLPYQYALEAAQSQQATLEGQIRDMAADRSRHRIARSRPRERTPTARKRRSPVPMRRFKRRRRTWTRPRRACPENEADYAYAENNVLRLEPLLVKQFVTVDLVDQARTSRSVKGEAVRQARSRLALAQAQWASAVAQQNEAQAGYEQSTAQLDQSDEKRHPP